MNLNTAIWILKSLLGLAKGVPAECQHPVLIVEDNRHDWELLEMFCAKYGAKAMWAPSLEVARGMLAKQKFRLMFVDEGMKDGSGVG